MRVLKVQTLYLSSKSQPTNTTTTTKEQQQHQRNVDKRKPVGWIECRGSVFGCTVGALLRYVARPKQSIPHLLRMIRSSLEPARMRSVWVDGADSNYLRDTLASSRVCRQQILSWGSQGESNNPKGGGTSARREARDSYGATAVLGIVPAILATVSCLGLSNLRTQVEDCQWLLDHETIACALKIGMWILEGAIPRWFGASPAFEQTAIDIEMRMVQRAKRGLAASAAFLAARTPIGPVEQFKFQVAFVIRAVWPSDEIVDVRTHAELLAKLDHEQWFFRPDNMRIPPTRPNQVLPLSQLVLVTSSSRKRRQGCSDAESSSGRSSSAGSGWSGWSGWSAESAESATTVVDSTSATTDALCSETSGLSVGAHLESR